MDNAMVTFHANGSVTITHWIGAWTTFNPPQHVLNLLAPRDLHRVRKHCRLDPIHNRRGRNDTLLCALTTVEMYAIGGAS